MALTLGIFFGIVLSFMHFAWESLAQKLRKYKMAILSFGFGASSAYIFLQLLPELYSGITPLNISAFILVLLGFAITHLMERYTYQFNKKNKDVFLKEVAAEHSIAFFAYHFLLGIILVNFIDLDISKGVFFFIPLLFYTMVSSLSLGEIHYDISRNVFYKAILSSSSLMGAIAGTYFFVLNEIQFYSLLGLVTGSIMYISVRDIVPEKESSKPLFFGAGVLLYLAISVYYWKLRGFL